MIQKPRGTQDIIGEEFNKRRELENKFFNHYFAKGYQGIETPIFEQRNLFVRSVGDDTDIVQKELFDLEKKSDETYSLRPEFTAGVIRALIETGIKGRPLPIMLVSSGPCFRYEKPQKGRRRQFNQLNMEVIGKKSPEIDGEFISAAVDFLKSIGLEGIIVNINSLGSSQTRMKFAGKIKTFLSENKDDLCDLCQNRLDRNPLRVLDCKNPECREVVVGAPTIIDTLTQEEKQYFDEALAYLKERQIYYLEDPSLVRGLDYYTGVIFEFNVEGDESRMASVGGGGRYDELIKELDGPDLPAIGVALGFERIVETLK